MSDKYRLEKLEKLRSGVVRCMGLVDDPGCDNCPYKGADFACGYMILSDFDILLEDLRLRIKNDEA